MKRLYTRPQHASQSVLTTSIAREQPVSRQIHLHPLWLDSIKSLWTLLKQNTSEESTSQFLGYTRFKEFRLALDRALHPSRTYDESLAVVWHEWTELNNFHCAKTHRKLTSLIELAMANGHLSQSTLSQLLADLFHSTELSLVGQLTKLNAAILHITTGASLATSCLKPYAEVTPLNGTRPAVSRNNFSIFMPLSGIAQQVKALLKQLLPLDVRVEELWSAYEAPKELPKCMLGVTRDRATFKLISPRPRRRLYRYPSTRRVRATSGQLTKVVMAPVGAALLTKSYQEPKSTDEYLLPKVQLTPPAKVSRCIIRKK